MIVTKLYGGLGNQMFQYAAGLALADRLKTKLYLDLDWFEFVKDKPNATQRVYQLDVFGIEPKQLSALDRWRLKWARPYKESGQAYQPDFKQLSGNVVLDGYWQSYKYFDDRQALVHKSFEFKKPLSKAGVSFLNKIKAKPCVSVHVRRSDYVSAKRNDFIGTMPVNYYVSAYKKLVAKHGHLAAYVFSDDLKWCRSNLQFDGPTTFIEGLRDDEDLRLMSSCQHNIIANSSFSWWAAWLNQHTGKSVVAPKQWFKDGNFVAADRLPKDWLLL